MLLSLLLLTQETICRWVHDHWLELFGVVSSLLYICLEVKQKSSMWIVGFFSSTVYAAVFFQSRLYADSILNVYYMAASVYGMYCWRFAPENDDAATVERPVGRLSRPSGIVLAVISVALYTGMGYALDKHTDSPVPYCDALIASLSFVATWMLARKILEHWILWIFINFFSSGLFFWRELYPTAGLFIVYGVMSIAGWFRWKQSFNHQVQ